MLSCLPSPSPPLVHHVHTCVFLHRCADGNALRPALLWMDMRSADQAGQVLATRDEALHVNSGGAGPVSAEWMVNKALWIKQNEPDIFAVRRQPGLSIVLWVVGLCGTPGSNPCAADGGAALGGCRDLQGLPALLRPGSSLSARVLVPRLAASGRCCCDGAGLGAHL